MQKTITLISFALLLCGCAGAAHQATPVQPEVPAGVGTAAQHTPLTGPGRCSAAIMEYEKIVDRDVTTGYLSQNVYDQIVRDINGGARPACASGRDGEAMSQLARVKSAHGYR
jgi:hypothetical protein